MVGTKRNIYTFLFVVIFSLFFSVSVHAESTLQAGEKTTGQFMKGNDQVIYDVILTKPGLLTVDLSSYMQGGVTIEAHDENGDRVFRQYVNDGTVTNPKKLSVSEYLEAGTYQIKLSNPYTTEGGRFDIQTNFTPANNNEIEPNNGTVQAQPLKFDEKVTGLISWNDDLDTYKVTLQKPGKLTIQADSYIKEFAHIRLEDHNGKQVFMDTIGPGHPTNPKKFEKSVYLEAGDYYVHVEKYRYYGYTGLYDLEINFTETNNNEVEPNNGTVQAQTIALNEKVTGLLSWNDELDTYKVVINSPGEFSINLATYIERSIYIDLEDDKGKRVYRNSTYGGTETNPKQLNKDIHLERGTYYIHVSNYAGSMGTYDLSITNKVNFTDVKPGVYYYEPVIKLSSAGIIQGYTDGTFRPEATLTRWQTVLLLQRALDLKIPANYKEIAGQFKDAGSNHRYAKEIAAVYEAGIFQGYNGRLGLNDQLTREQMASVLVRAFDLKADPAKNSLANVKDAGQILAVHKQDVKALYDLNVTTGKGGGKYAPKDKIKRGEFATFLNRVMN